MSPDQAYPPQQRWAYAEQHVVIAASLGWLETTISREIARTYGLPEFAVVEIKALKARHRNELSFGEGK